MIRKIYLKLTEVAVGVFEKETNMQLLFLAYTKEKKKSHKQIFLPGFPPSAEITHIYCGWSWQIACYVGEIQISHFPRLVQKKDESQEK